MRLAVASAQRTRRCCSHANSRCRGARCPFCGAERCSCACDATAIGVRCIRCAASTMHLVIGSLLRETIANLSACDVCELSARGPLVEHLRRRARSVACSEYFADVPRGGLRNGDTLRGRPISSPTRMRASISHAHRSAGARARRRGCIRRAARVLRPGGHAPMFTVPIARRPTHTVERRAAAPGRELEHLHPPVLPRSTRCAAAPASSRFAIMARHPPTACARRRLCRRRMLVAARAAPPVDGSPAGLPARKSAVKGRSGLAGMAGRAGSRVVMPRQRARQAAGQATSRRIALRSAPAITAALLSRSTAEPSP